MCVCDNRMSHRNRWAKIAKRPSPPQVAVALSRIEPLAPDARQEEIARMLAGATITEEARAAARRLIEAAQAG